MTETVQIAASKRDVIGKANRKLAGGGKLPAVVYGAGHDATPISIDRHGFEHLMSHTNLGSILIKLDIDGGDAVNVILKSVQVDPIKGSLQHVDFLAIKMNQKISTVVPISFVGSSAGEKTGGVLMHNIREIHIEVLPRDLPEHIEVDVSPLEVGDNLHLSDVVLPDGVTLLDDPEGIVCSVTAPTIVEEPEEAVEGLEEEAEPEVIGEAAEEETEES